MLLKKKSKLREYGRKWVPLLEKTIADFLFALLEFYYLYKNVCVLKKKANIYDTVFHFAFFPP